MASRSLAGDSPITPASDADHDREPNPVARMAAVSGLLPPPVQAHDGRYPARYRQCYRFIGMAART